MSAKAVVRRQAEAMGLVWAVEYYQDWVELAVWLDAVAEGRRVEKPNRLRKVRLWKLRLHPTVLADKQQVRWCSGSPKKVCTRRLGQGRCTEEGKAMRIWWGNRPYCTGMNADPVEEGVL